MGVWEEHRYDKSVGLHDVFRDISYIIKKEWKKARLWDYCSI